MEMQAVGERGGRVVKWKDDPEFWVCTGIAGDQARVERIGIKDGRPNPERKMAPVEELEGLKKGVDY
jgi:hypothetical protein